MGDDLNRRSRRVPFQFTLWGLFWLVALSSVFLAAYRGLGMDGLTISFAAVFGAIVGHALGNSIATGRLRCFGAVAGGAIGGLVGNPLWYAPANAFVIGLGIGACWLLLVLGSRPSATGAASSKDAHRTAERLGKTRKALVEAALVVAAAGLVFAGLLGIIAFATANPLDRWFIAMRVFALSAGVALLVALTLAGLSLLLGLAARPSGNSSRQNHDYEDLWGVIVTIDGPAGAGKSTVARALARRLGFRYLDTGAMYRAVALAGLRHGLDWDRPDDLAQRARKLRIEVDEDRVLLDGEDVTQAIRTLEVTAVTRYAADNREVRRHLVELQRAAAAGHDVVTEGRDQGSVAFPDAQCKIFLTASPEERARRRCRDLEAQGEPQPFEQVLEAINQRDREDAGRPVGALVRPPDAIEVDTDGLSPEQVVDRLESIVRGRCPGI